MKSQIKLVIANQIRFLEDDLKSVKSSINYHYQKCDVTDKSDESKYNFSYLNFSKTQKRILEKKLKNLRELQVEVKSISSYTKVNSKSEIIRGTQQHVIKTTTLFF